MATKSKIKEISTRSSRQLGSALNQVRKIKKLSQANLSRLANLRQGTISKAESGISTTTLKTIYDICTALNLELVLRERESKKTTPFDPQEVFD